MRARGREIDQESAGNRNKISRTCSKGGPPRGMLTTSKCHLVYPSCGRPRPEESFIQYLVSGQSRISISSGFCGRLSNNANCSAWAACWRLHGGHARGSGRQAPPRARKTVGHSFASPCSCLVRLSRSCPLSTGLSGARWGWSGRESGPLGGTNVESAQTMVTCR